MSPPRTIRLKSNGRTNTGVGSGGGGLVWIALLLATCSLLGCRLAAVRTLPRDERAIANDDPPSVCTKSEWYPLLDVIGFGAGAALLVAGASEDSAVVTALGAGATASFGLSAGFGFATAPGCEDPARPAETARR